MTRSFLILALVAIIALSFTPQVAAFGAGNIPSFSYLEDKAFRHGDIEDILVDMLKVTGSGFLSRGTKFTGLDVKRAVDVGALKKANLQTILNVVLVLGFLAHGYVTNEFEATKERVGCYLPVEHIDNPKGYADGEDARQYDPRLRGPIDPRELEIDPQTGMKNYIANEQGGWDTSKALVRRLMIQCIELGRKFKQTGDKNDQYEAFRLLGTFLHTLEDFTAHSNYCELALISMGHQNVFPHVGQNVKIRAPNGRDVYPLVTGTFGGADFIHSLMGEATDHLSQASVSDLVSKISHAKTVEEVQSSSANRLRTMFFDLPGSDGQELNAEMERVQNRAAGAQSGAEQLSPQDLYKVLWQILSFRDSVMKSVERTIDRIPGLSSLTEKISNSVSIFVITTMEPFVKPLIGNATNALQTSSQAVIDSHDQYEVWNDWNASDPTHSFLSKDHFALLLNQPAGEIAKIIVKYTVERVVRAWDDPKQNPQAIAEDVLQVLHHPDFRNPQCECLNHATLGTADLASAQIQNEMFNHMGKWLNELGGNKNQAIDRLTADSVKGGKNKRIGDNSTDTAHVHNPLLPDGGLQAVIAAQGGHMPGASYLNAGQDLASGKMPWQQGFGSGGSNAWRGADESNLQQQPQHGAGGGQQFGQDQSYQQPQHQFGRDQGFQQDNYSFGGGNEQNQQQQWGGNQQQQGQWGQQQQQQQQQGQWGQQRPNNEGFPGAGFGRDNNYQGDNYQFGR
ncbi:uncharacterized protein LOC62_03G004590 [Vanrija pseudolonga]|uniref:Het-C-domain-containing protein n=1 Tax=Vanrija pseudolonga TaxID=143232 RepID=A0AAF0Y7Z2_9TREE|nr:hypothetical protein LOC62_03G004590 [Vanrija pseudolonga]